MPDQVQSPVVGATPSGVSSETPASAGVPAGTSSQTPNDAQTIANLTRDMNRLRSSLQQQMAQQAQAYQAREADYQRQLYEAQSRGLDENQRRQLDAQLLAQQNTQLQQQLQQQQQYLQAQETMRGWADYFVQQGAPRERLDLSSPDALLSSGWGFVNERLAGAVTPQVPVPTSSAPLPSAGVPNVSAAHPTVAAPAVVTQTGGVPQPATFASVRQAYGFANDEQLYRAIETGQLSPEVLPKPPDMPAQPS